MESGNPITEKESGLEKMNEKANKPPGSDDKIANEVDFERHRPLFDAGRHGNWEMAKTNLDQHPDAVRARIDVSGNTLLHVAVSAGHLHIVKELVQLLTEEDLMMRQKDGFTVLTFAIVIGNISIVKYLIRENKKLVRIFPTYPDIPISVAVTLGFQEMARYLYSETPGEDLTLPENGMISSSLISECIYRKQFDIPIHLLGRCPGLAITVDNFDRLPVLSLASSATKSVFATRSQLRFWQRWVYDGINIGSDAANQISMDVQNLEDSQMDKNDLTPIRSVLVGLLARMPSNLLQFLDVKDIYEKKLAHVQYLQLLSIMRKAIETSCDGNQINNVGVLSAIGEAIHRGNVEFIINITKANPELMWSTSVARYVFMLAIEHRQAEVFSLIHGLPDKQLIACYYDPDTRDNLLHKAASIPSSKILNLIPGGAALQMQRELQWFKEVGSIVTPAQHIFTNKDFLRPEQLFTENHKDLVIAGEKWMKDTSSSCSVVGALIVTITFAAAFTVPGGNDQNMGFPIFRNKQLFKVFFISDAISLFASTTSVLMFLGILTSRYAEEDFLKSLPTKMIIGLSTLFFSIATMMIAFCAAVSVMLPETWIVLLVCLLASVPIASFIRIQFHLLVDIFMSTYGPSIFKRNIKPWLDSKRQ
ncbi:uncharacterized protein LOC21395448 [Morus notabilis]|uniref:uncharacterized protein LOC21395448 n=1 Tax=Morus notabilis TaxID=981085 RepID=UPI000CED3573|nr:uncharacterized protein LOC21395448 [Morus notabilis]XP_024018095.1 uncharacterized protein LOC21395448 [Morus notabilis]